MTETRVGDLGPDFHFGPVTKTHIVRYAGAATDFNPLHHDDEFARNAGYPSVFAHGMLTAGILASYLTRWFDADSVVRYGVQFRDIVYLGDTLSAVGRVVAVHEEPTRHTADLEIELRRQTGEAAVIGTATVITDMKNEAAS